MSSPSTSENGKTPTIKILLVDPLPDSLEHLRYILDSEPDFKVIDTASHGLEAVRKAVQTVPDVLIMDIDTMGGLEASSRLTKTLPTVAVIVISTYTNLDYTDQALRADARVLLHKPLDMKALYFSIRDLYEQYRPIHIIDRYDDFLPSKRRRHV